MDATNMKTASEDTVFAVAKKLEHNQIDPAEYAKNRDKIGFSKPSIVIATTASA